MTNLDSIFKSRDITLPTKVRLVKAMVFPVVMYGCEIWTVKKAEHRRIDAFELWCWRRLLRVPWTAAAAKSLQSCLTLWDPIDSIPPGSSVHGILQARILEWVATPSSRGSSPPRDQTSISCIAGGCFTTEPWGKPPNPQLPAIATYSCCTAGIFETVQYLCHIPSMAFSR